MKKLLPVFSLLLFLITGTSVNAQILWQDNMDSYVSDSIIDPQSPDWVGWGNDVTSAYVSDDTSSSPSNSLKIWNATVPGSTVAISDVLHVFPNYTTGRYLLKFKVYVPTNVSGSDGATYWNIQHLVDPNTNTGLEWAFEVQIRAASNPTLSSIEVGGNTYSFQAKYDQWVEVVHIFDLDRDQHDFFYDGILITSQPFSYQSGSTSGTNQLAGLDLFANCDGGTNCVELAYYDDFVFMNYPLPPNDAAVLSIDSPKAVCAGNYDVYATIGNYGSSQLDSVTINWEINGIVQTPVNYTQMIDTINGSNPNTAQVFLGNGAFVAGSNTIKVYTSNPNANIDSTNYNDTISITLQSANPPTGLTVYNTNGNDATFIVDGSTGTVDYEFGTLGFTLGTGTLGTTSNNPFNITGLLPNTSYDIYIRNNCGVSTSTWIGPFTFMTTCTAINSPLIEDFTSSSTPTCWIEGGDNSWDYNTGAGYAAASIGDHTGNGGNYAWMDGSDNTGGDISSLTTVPVDLQSITTPELNYWVFYNNTNSAARNILEVEFYDGATWHLIDTIQQNLGSTWVNRIIDLSTYTITGPVKARFTITGSSVASAFHNDILLDDIKIWKTPTCFAPFDFQVDLVSYNQVNISFTDTNIATQWEVEVGTLGFTLGTGMDTLIGSNPATISGLSPNTNYDLYIRTACGINDSSIWVGPFNFLTLCTPDTATYFNDFETEALDFPPSCWSAVTTNSGSFVEVEDFTGTAAPYAGSRGLYIYGSSGNASTDTVMAITPAFSDLVVGNKQIRFFANSDDPVSQLVVGTMSNPFSTVMNVIDTITLLVPDVYQEVIVELTTANGYNGTDQYIFLEHSLGGSLDYIRIDDFYYEQIPTCKKPLDLSASNVRSTSADLTWTEVNVATEWLIEYGTGGFTLGTGVVDTVVSNPTTITGLTPNTTYEFYVQSVCGRNDSSIWSGPVQFVTPCAVVTSYPYLEDFNTFVPACWEEANNGSIASGPTDFGTGSWIADEFLNITTNTDAARINLFSTGKEDWLLSGPFDLSAGGAQTYQLKLKAGLTDFGNTDPASMGSDDQVHILVSTDNGISWNSIYMWDINNQPTNTGSTVFIPLSAYTGNYNLFAIWATEGTVDDPEDYDFFVEDFEIRVTPSCLEPISLSASNLTDSSATLSWVENNAATEWVIEYGTSGFTPGTGILDTVQSNPFTITGLSPQTDYEFYVRSVCAPTDSSAWTGPSPFTTPCASVVSYPYLNDFSVFLPNCWDEATDGTPITGPTGFGTGSWVSDDYLNDVSNGDAAKINLFTTGKSDWIVSEPFDLSGAGAQPYELRLKAGVTDFANTNPSAMGSDDEVQLLVSTDGGLTWITLYTWNISNTPSSTGDLISIPLGAYTGTNNIFGIWATEGTVNDPEDYDFFIDDFEIRLTPTCLEPSNLTASNITGTTADLAWTENNAATEWIVEYGPNGFTPGTGTIDTVSSNPYTLTGLSPATDYEFYVRSICAANDTSFRFGPAQFVTPCVPITAPYYQSFDSAPAATSFSGIPCWTAIGPGAADIDIVTDPDGTNIGPVPSLPNAIEFNDGLFASDTSILVSPQFSDLGTGLNRIRFQAAFESTNALEGIYVGVMTNPTSTSSFIPIDTIDANDIGNVYGFGQVIINLTDTALYGNSQYIAFAHGDGSGNFEVYIDDFHYEAIPSCLSPSNLTATNITDNSVVLDWTEVNSASQWTVEYGPLGFIPGTGTSVSVSTKPYTLTGLNSNTTYEFLVRSICTPNDSSYTASGSFSTDAAVPFFEDFEEFGSITSNLNFKGWQNVSTSALEWESGTTTSSGSTGPDADHTIGAGGTFIYLETSSGSQGDFADLLSTPILVNNNQDLVILEFWYHKYGATMQDLEVYVDSNGVSNLIAVIPGETHTSGTDPWTKARAYIAGYEGKTIQLRFRGYKGSSFTGDMAIDDVQLMEAPAKDIALTNLVSPFEDINYCYSASEAVAVELRNTGKDSIDFAVDTAIVTVNITGAATLSLVDTISDNSIFGMPLPTFASMSVPMGSLNMTAPGAYYFDISVTMPADSPTTNNTFLDTVFVTAASGGLITGPDSICAGDTVVLSVNGHIGDIQWQSGTAGIFTDIPGADSTEITVTPGSTTSYRVVSCGATFSDTLTIEPIILSQPIAFDSMLVITCGDTGIVALVATSTNPNAFFEWFDVPVGGTALTAGGNIVSISANGDTLYYMNSSIDTNSPAIDTFYVEEVVNYAGGGSSNILITEMDLGGSDLLEIQNVSAQTVDVTGWTVAVSDNYSDINQNTFITLTGTMNPGDIKTWSDGTIGTAWGSNILWNPGAYPTFTGWIMILDAQGNIVDVLFENWTQADILAMNTTINGHPISITNEWIGDGVDGTSAAAGLSFQRNGNIDSDDLNDFVLQNTSHSLLNPGLIIPFPGGGCVSTRDTAIAIIDCIVGIDEIQSSFANISIYPNPSKGVFHIVGNQVKDQIEVSIFNSNGKMVYHSSDKLSNNFDEMIDISGLAKGMYFVKLQNKDSMEMKKIVIQ